MTDDFLSDKHAFVSINIIDKSVRLRNSNTKPDPSQIPLKSPILNRRPLICATKKYLNNFFPQGRVAPGNQTYANAVATEKKKTCIIEEWLKEVLEQVKNVTLLFLNVFEALIQSHWTHSSGRKTRKYYITYCFQ